MTSRKSIKGLGFRPLALLGAMAAIAVLLFGTPAARANAFSTNAPENSSVLPPASVAFDVASGTLQFVLTSKTVSENVGAKPVS